MKPLVPIYRRLGLQLLLLFVVYSVCRLLFLLLNRGAFSGLDRSEGFRLFFYGLRFDAAAIAAINALYIALRLVPHPVAFRLQWEKILRLVFFLPNVFFLLFEAADWVYFRYTGKRATADVLGMLTRPSDFLQLVPGFLRDYWYAPLAMIAIGLALWHANRWIERKTPLVPTPFQKKTFLIGTLGMAASIVVVVITIRGGIQRIPIGIRNAVQVTDSRYVPVVLNTPFSIITSFATPGLEEMHYLPDAEAAALFPFRHAGSGNGMRKRNVVVIILESCSREFTRLGPGPSYTPFLDSLMGRSLNCTQAFANGLHSAEGIPAVMAGIPSLMPEAFSTSVYGTNAITTLPNLLKRSGYRSAFFHGGTNGTMSFDVFAAAAGYGAYRGRTEYNNESDYDGAWGIPDAPFLQFFARSLDTLPQPFCVSLFTLSSHPPYQLPESYRSPLPANEGRLHRAVRYTDDALRAFFAGIARAPWYRNTLFVITADHASPDNTVRHYRRGIGAYAIPLLFFAPGDSALRGEVAAPVQQIDILPSVLDYLQYDSPAFAFGNSLFDTAARRFVVTENSGAYQWIDGSGWVLTMAGSRPAGLFAFPSDSGMRRNVLPLNRAAAFTILQRFRAFVQRYREALIHNRMVLR